jgi:hypothetical protein
VRALWGDAAFLRSFVSFFFSLFGHRTLALDRPERRFSVSLWLVTQTWADMIDEISRERRQIESNAA